MNGGLGIKRFVNPETVTTHFHVREGDVVGDFGAGSGFFAEVLAKKVGANGRVYAFEIQKELVEKIGVMARSKGLFMINALWCDLEQVEGVKVSDGTLDIAIMVNTLFQLEDKGTALGEVYRTVRAGGRFYIIDWSESFGGLGPQQGQVLTKQEALALIQQHGFGFEREFDAGDHHYGIAFRKI